MNEEAIAIVERYDALSATMEQREINRLARQLETAYNQFESEFLRQYDGVARQDNLLANQRRAVLMDDLSRVLQQIDPARREEYERRFQSLMQRAYEQGDFYADEVLRALDPDSPIRPLANVNLEAAVLQSREAVNRLYRYNDDFRDRASAVIEQGLIQGWSGRRTREALEDAGLPNLTRYAAERIVRTERAAAFNSAAQRRYRQNGIQGVQWVTTIGDVCPFCVARNGNVYETGTVQVPGHPHCRCMLLPWQPEWADMGLTDQEFLDDYRESRITELQRIGGRPNNGPTAFERAAGMSRAPTPIWRP